MISRTPTISAMNISMNASFDSSVSPPPVLIVTPSGIASSELIRSSSVACTSRALAPSPTSAVTVTTRSPLSRLITELDSRNSTSAIVAIATGPVGLGIVSCRISLIVVTFARSAVISSPWFVFSCTITSISSSPIVTVVASLPKTAVRSVWDTVRALRPNEAAFSRSRLSANSVVLLLVLRSTLTAPSSSPASSAD